MASYVAVAVASALPYASVLWDGTTGGRREWIENWDDQDNYMGQPALRESCAHSVWDARRWTWAFADAGTLGVYEPVALLVKSFVGCPFAGDDGDERGHGGHAAAAIVCFSVLLHVINALLVVNLCRRVLMLRAPYDRASARTAAAWAALIFALHPQRVEVACWASAMPYALAACLGLCSVIFFVLAKQMQHGVWRACAATISVVAFALACYSKAVVLPLVVLLPALAMWMRQNALSQILAGVGRHAKGGVLSKKVVALILTAVHYSLYVVVAAMAVHHTLAASKTAERVDAIAQTREQQVLRFILSTSTAVRLLLLPRHLSAMYPLPADGLDLHTNPDLVNHIAIVVGLLLVVVLGLITVVVLAVWRAARERSDIDAAGGGAAAADHEGRSKGRSNKRKGKRGARIGSGSNSSSTAPGAPDDSPGEFVDRRAAGHHFHHRDATQQRARNGAPGDPTGVGDSGDIIAQDRSNGSNNSNSMSSGSSSLHDLAEVGEATGQYGRDPPRLQKRKSAVRNFIALIGVYLLCLAPTLTGQHGYPMVTADRYSYVPSIAIAPILATLLCEVFFGQPWRDNRSWLTQCTVSTPRAVKQQRKRKRQTKKSTDAGNGSGSGSGQDSGLGDTTGGPSDPGSGTRVATLTFRSEDGMLVEKTSRRGWGSVVGASLHSALFLICTLWALQSGSYAAAWRNSVSLWTQAAASAPSNSLAYSNLRTAVHHHYNLAAEAGSAETGHGSSLPFYRRDSIDAFCGTMGPLQPSCEHLTRLLVPGAAMAADGARASVSRGVPGASADAAEVLLQLLGTVDGESTAVLPSPAEIALLEAELMRLSWVHRRAVVILNTAYVPKYDALQQYPKMIHQLLQHGLEKEAQEAFHEGKLIAQELKTKPSKTSSGGKSFVPWLARSIETMARTALEEGEPSVALRLTQLLSKEYPDSPRNTFNLGNMLALNERPKEAAAAYRDAATQFDKHGSEMAEDAARARQRMRVMEAQAQGARGKGQA